MTRSSWKKWAEAQLHSPMIPTGTPQACRFCLARQVFSTPTREATRLDTGYRQIITNIFGLARPLKLFSAVGYDVSKLGVFHWAVVTAGTLAELILPALIVLVVKGAGPLSLDWRLTRRSPDA